MITIVSNTGAISFSSPQEGGVQTSPEFEETTNTLSSITASGSSINMVDLADVNPDDLNHNDVLVFDAISGHFKPIDIDVINNNDGGTW